MKEKWKLKLDVFHAAYCTPSPFVLSVVTDQRSVTKSKDEQKTASFDFGATRLRSGRTVFRKILNSFLRRNGTDVESSYAH